jgi:hypothetical protein
MMPRTLWIEARRQPTAARRLEPGFASLAHSDTVGSTGIRSAGRVDGGRANWASLAGIVGRMPYGIRHDTARWQ